MFEESLVESRISHVTLAKQWTTFTSITLQCSVAATLVMMPLMHPERLVLRMAAPTMLTPLPPKPSIRVQPAQPSSTHTSTSVPLPAVLGYAPPPPLFPGRSAPTDEVPPTSIATMTMPGAIPAALTVKAERDAASVSVAPAKAASRPMRISNGVSAGMLIVPIRPVYPAIAKAAGVQGMVIVAAVISPAGSIESLRVISGPAMLQNAAVEAIRTARYRPYRLNGEPTEVETTITINFRMGG